MQIYSLALARIRAAAAEPRRSSRQRHPRLAGSRLVPLPVLGAMRRYSGAISMQLGYGEGKNKTFGIRSAETAQPADRPG